MTQSGKYKSFIRWSRDTNAGADLASQQEFVQEIVNNQTFITNVTNNEEFVTQIIENNEFITQLVTNETFVTELTTNETFVTELVENNEFITQVVENNTYVTNVQTIVTAQINGKKGIANELATLDADSQLTTSQIPSELMINPMSAAGDMMYGGAGTPTGYEDLMNKVGVSIIHANTGGSSISNIYDADVTTVGFAGGAGQPEQWVGVDASTAHFVGRFRFIGYDYLQNSNNTPTNGWHLQSSNDGSNWTDRYDLPTNHAGSTVTSVRRDYGNIDLPLPVSARYWRLRGDNASANGWYAYTLQIFAVTATGAGNAVRLAAPASRRVMTFDVDIGAPVWPDPAAANADTSGATLLQLETEVNELKAILRAAGILAG